MKRKIDSAKMRRKKLKGKTKAPRKKFRLPRAFRIVRMAVKGPRREHAHMLDQPGHPPCPEGSTYVTTIVIDRESYCIYTQGGMQFAIDCGPA